jgi:hypothetical protein
MRRIAVLALVVVAAAVAACDSSQRASTVLGPISSLQAAKSSGPPVVSLIVTVSNTDAFGNPSGITNDRLGTYVDGSQFVSAHLDQYGNFAFDTDPGRSAAIRWVNYNFNNPVDSTNTFRPTQDHTQNYHFSTGGTAFSPFIPIQNLGVNGNPSTECGYMGNGFAANSKTTYRVSFHKGNEDTQNSPTAFAVFTRTSVSPAVWTVQPVGSCSPNSNVASLRSGDGTVLYGYYTIPFFFTLKAK